ncbi:hypothetical protein CDL15_Pgr027273 [Punica granatum]|uniref:RRM domain-containing protein n=1 Tax=Punica granatum TaxID=22663 RepID=A0A218XM28_PUNGR|nr:hypothetical protein CDL15_Pgr027273 [Punica granatum]
MFEEQHESLTPFVVLQWKDLWKLLGDHKGEINKARAMAKVANSDEVPFLELKIEVETPPHNNSNSNGDRGCQIEPIPSGNLPTGFDPSTCLAARSVVELTNGSSEDDKEDKNMDAPENNPLYTGVTQLDLHRHFHATQKRVIFRRPVSRETKGFGFVRYSTHGNELQPTPSTGGSARPRPYLLTSWPCYERQVAMSKMGGMHLQALMAAPQAQQHPSQAGSSHENEHCWSQSANLRWWVPECDVQPVNSTGNLLHTGI